MEIVYTSAELLEYTRRPLRLIEKAGRTCYKSEEKITAKSSRAFVKRLLQNEHESVMEHASATLRLVCDRGISHEQVRHRLTAISQESTRYCNYGRVNSVKFIPPCTLKTCNYRLWLKAMKSAEQYYFYLLERGEPPQNARSVLPTGTKTELVVTANFREWRLILKQRLSLKAHPDMRKMMKLVHRELMGICPLVFTEFSELALK